MHATGTETLMRMLKINGHKDVTLYEMQGYGHGMVEPAIPPLLDFIARIRPADTR